MKNKILTIGFVASLLALTSCSDFLTEDAKGRLTPESFPQNRSELDMSVYALYAQVQGFQCNSNPMIMQCQGDDVTSTTGSNKAAYLSADAFETPTDSKGLKDGWNWLYKIVMASNQIIDEAEKPQVSEKEKKIALGQAYYWRAFAYFSLVRLFGPLPMNLHNVPDNNTTKLTSVENVYKQIISDLTSAENCNLPSQYVAEPQAIDKQNVYVSEQAVKATIAAVYMAMAGYPLNKTEYYAKAAAKAKEVIDGVNAGKYNQKLLSDWSQVYSYGNNHHPETLLGIDYNDTPGGWNSYDSQLSSCQQLGSLQGWGDFLPERRYWAEYPAGPRKDAIFAKQLLLNDGKTLVDWWATKDGEPYKVTTGTDGKVVSNSVIAEYRPMYVEFTINDGPSKAPYDYTKPFWGGMCINKRHQLIRYSEVLLWYAESAARSGGDLTAAKAALKQVRQRAYSDKMKISEIDNMNAEQLAEAAYTEHGYEVAGYVLAMVTRRADQFRMNRLKEHYDYRHGEQKVILVPKGTLTHSQDKAGHPFTYKLKEDLILKENMPVTVEWRNLSSIYHDYPPTEVEKNGNLKR